MDTIETASDRFQQLRESHHQGNEVDGNCKSEVEDECDLKMMVTIFWVQTTETMNESAYSVNEDGTH
jgi:hypothetical protein